MIIAVYIKQMLESYTGFNPYWYPNMAAKEGEFFRLSSIHQATPQMQHHVFLACVCDDTMKIIDNFPIPPSNRLDIKEIIRHLQLSARGQLNETVEHHNLAKQQQQPCERFEDFLTSIRDLTKTP